MFTIDANITDLKAKERNLFKVLFSMNIHQVATPEMTIEDARSYVFFFRDGGKVHAYIGLYFMRTDRSLYYSHSSNPFPEGQLADVEGEARVFSEDMGAMLDEIDFAKLSTEEKNGWINDQEILTGRKKETECSQDLPSPAADEQSVPSDQSSPVEQPVPVVQVPVQPAAVSQPPVNSAPPVQLRPGQQPKQLSRPQKKAAPVQATVQPNAGGFVVETDQSVPVKRTDDVLEHAMKAGVVKAPNAQLKKDIRSASGVVSRDKEALARLLASF